MWVVIILLAVGLGLVFGPGVLNRIYILARFRLRKAYSESQIYESYFISSYLDRDVLISKWKELARAIGIPWCKLRGSDRFSRELRKPFPDWIDTNEDWELVELLDDLESVMPDENLTSHPPGNVERVVKLMAKAELVKGSSVKNGAEESAKESGR